MHCQCLSCQVHVWKILYEYTELEQHSENRKSDSMAWMIRGCSVVTSVAEEIFLSGIERRLCRGEREWGMTFGHLGTGTVMTQLIPKLWEWEREWKFHSQFLGPGTGVDFPFPNFGNGNETLLFPGMTGNRNGNGIAKLCEYCHNPTFILNLT